MTCPCAPHALAWWVHSDTGAWPFPAAHKLKSKHLFIRWAPQLGWGLAWPDTCGGTLARGRGQQRWGNWDNRNSIVNKHFFERLPELKLSVNWNLFNCRQGV